MLEAIITAATCGEACWSAREDVCRCSCGGANHGCLRTADGTAPARTSKINGEMHRLMAVGNQDQMHTHAVGLNKAAGCPFTFADSAREKYMAGPFKTRRATEDQVAKWPELAGMRNWRETERYWNNAPYLLWGKESVINAAQA